MRRLVLVLIAVQAVAAGYPIVIHNRLPDVLLRDPSVQGMAAIPPETGLDRFRTRFYDLAVRSARPDLRQRFLKRYPKAADFTAQAFKEFLGMTAVHAALGFDPYADVESARNPHGPVRGGQERTILEWIRIGSIYPDLDRRNQDRWWVKNGQVQRAADGQRIPYDPVVLNMGGVEGLTGQAHAHYGLNRHPKSEDPEVLKSRPGDFAVRAGFPQAPVLTFAPERAQAYGDLSLIALHLREPALAALFAGNGFHYLGDASNQIHTLQVGIYEFFRDATIEAWKQKLLTLGGLLGPARDYKQVGLDIITNHHTWSEEMFRIAFERGEVNGLFEPDAGSINAATLLQATDRIILAGNPEGAEIYRLVRNATNGRLREAGARIDFDGKPDAMVLSYLKPGADLRRFLELERIGTRRAATAIAAWWRALGTEYSIPDCEVRNRGLSTPSPKLSVNRLLEQQLNELDQAEARRNLFVKLHGGISGNLQGASRERL